MDIGEVHFVPGIRLRSFDALLFPELHYQREIWFRCNIPHIRLCHWPYQGHGEHFMLLSHTYMYLSRDDTKLENQMPRDMIGINIFYCH